ncbi:flippase-like domain-containing protein [Cellulomonas hominis]
MPGTSPTAPHVPGPVLPRPERRTVDGVVITDAPEIRVHHPSDLLGLVLSALGVVLVLVLATYAQNTATGVVEDVQGAASLLRRLLFVPVALLESIVTFVVPLAVLTELAVRRLGRQLLEALVAGIVALLVCSTVTWAVAEFGSDHLVDGLSVRVDGAWTLTIPGYVALIAGLLSEAGPRNRRRTVTWSWNALWATIVIVIVTSQVSLPGVAVALLVGRVCGLGVRYISGVQSERAYGASLVAGVRRAGFVPVELRRVPDEPVPTEVPTPGDLSGAGASDGPRPPAAPVPVRTTVRAASPRVRGAGFSRSLSRYLDHRVYELRTADGLELDVMVLDGDRQVVGSLSRLWRSLRLRGIDGRSVVSLRQAAERSALLAYAAGAAGVRTPRLLSIAEADSSMLLVEERPHDAVPLADLDVEQITDELLQEVWAQLRLAHDAGIAHRALTSDSILVDTLLGRPMVWIVGWDQGDVASSEFSRRMDVCQLVALLALRVGATRALESAVAVLPDEDIASIGPLLQTIALPRRTRDEMRVHREVLAELRSALVARLPQADVQPQQLVRFGARTIFTIFLTAVAAIVILTTINVSTIAEALSQSDWRWSIVAFALGLLTLVGAGLALVGFAPVKVTVWRATLAQSAATFIALAAPAGIGPAALNLRLLTRRGVSASLATATVALVQVSQLVVTVLLLLGLSIASGTNQTTRLPVSPLILAIIGALAALVAAALLVPPVRQWLAAKTMPTLRQTWPRLIEVLGQPWRLALGIGGNALMTIGYVLAFDASLQAFGQDVPLVQVALVYLAGNTAGAIVPTPGGIGTIEFAFTSGLSAIGVNPGVAASVAVLFRVLTYWLRIPIGWASMRYLQRKGEV